MADIFFLVIPGQRHKRVYARLRRAMALDPESRCEFGMCFWIPGSPLPGAPE
jgi:hypothetical protein